VLARELSEASTRFLGVYLHSVQTDGAVGVIGGPKVLCLLTNSLVEEVLEAGEVVGRHVSAGFASWLSVLCECVLSVDCSGGWFRFWCFMYGHVIVFIVNGYR